MSDPYLPPGCTNRNINQAWGFSSPECERCGTRDLDDEAELCPDCEEATCG